ncbi:MAG: hypothetical protein JW995_11890 [Melioribacteraceae bacterium]|nr:hypothetical protein [Melioribacteraceae bacterium]
MWSLLDTLGAAVIGGMVILLVISINLQMNSMSSELIENNIVQTNTSESIDILKYDFYKIGYKATGEKISIADSNQIKYAADIDDNGSVDTIFYYFSVQNVDSGATNNPNRFLYRQENGGSTMIYSMLSDFVLTYFDSLGSQLNYASLSTSLQRSRIRSIRVEMSHSSNYMINNQYQTTDWTGIIRPKNLR